MSGVPRKRISFHPRSSPNSAEKCPRCWRPASASCGRLRLPRMKKDWRRQGDRFIWKFSRSLRKEPACRRRWRWEGISRNWCWGWSVPGKGAVISMQWWQGFPCIMSGRTVWSSRYAQPWLIPRCCWWWAWQ